MRMTTGDVVITDSKLLYDKTMLDALSSIEHDDIVDAMRFRPLPAKRVFASCWRVLNVDGFKEAREAARQLWWPTQYVSAEDLAHVYGEPAAAKPFVAPDAVSPYFKAWSGYRCGGCGDVIPNHGALCPYAAQK